MKDDTHNESILSTEAREGKMLLGRALQNAGVALLATVPATPPGDGPGIAINNSNGTHHLAPQSFQLGRVT